MPMPVPLPDTSERVKTAIEELSGIFESVVGDNVKRPPDFRSGKEVRKALPELGRSNAVYRVKRDRAIQKQVLIERRKTGWQVFDFVQNNGPTDTGSRYVLTRAPLLPSETMTTVLNSLMPTRLVVCATSRTCRKTRFARFRSATTKRRWR